MKHQEIEADQFAVQRAKSREELMAYKNFFDEAEEHNINFMMGLSEYKTASEKKRDLMMSKECFFKTDHPRPKVRAAMIQKYIDKWDAEHKS